MRMRTMKLAAKNSCQKVPTAAPMAKSATLKIPICHQVYVYDLNIFIFWLINLGTYSVDLFWILPQISRVVLAEKPTVDN